MDCSSPIQVKTLATSCFTNTITNVLSDERGVEHLLEDGEDARARHERGLRLID